MKNKDIGVVVTTGEHRGVFFGYVSDFEIPDNKVKKLKNARMCVHWSEDVHGVVGLSANGPTDNCKVTPSAPEIILTDVNMIMVCTDKATYSWESEPWR